MRHVSNTSSPLKTSTPTLEMTRLVAALCMKMLSSIAASSTHSPTVKKLPHALKSRWLSMAYSDSTPNAEKVRIAA